MFNIAVLASTKGTDLQAIIDEIKSSKLAVDLKVVISNVADCFALKRAKDQGFKTVFIDPKGKTRENFDQEIIEILEKEKVDLIVLVGYMRILSDNFVKKYPNKIINVHPALMPSFCGPGAMDLNVHEEVLKRGCKVTGCTIHFVNEICDGGPIILQKVVEVEDSDTPDTLKAKVQALEKKWYPEVIRWIKEEKVEVEGKRVSVNV